VIRGLQEYFSLSVFARTFVGYIAVFPILADPEKNNLKSAQLLIGREVVSGRMNGCRASVLHSCSCRDRPKLGRLQYIRTLDFRSAQGSSQKCTPYSLRVGMSPSG